MKELRKAERIKAATFATVYDCNKHELLGYLGNLTPNGALAVGEKPVKINGEIKLEIEFRGETGIPGGRLKFPARIVRCELDNRTGYYHTGFEFLSVSEASKRAIEKLVERYRFSLNMPD